MLKLNPKSQYLNSKQILNLLLRISRFRIWDLFRISDLGFIILFCFIFVTGCQNQALYKDSRVMMGTFVEVISSDKKAAPIVFKEIKRIEDLLSKYKENSEISRLNKEKELRVSPETFYLLEKAKEFWELTEGAFDITVGSLLDLWGFTERNYVIPSEKEIKETLEAVGMEKIILQKETNLVKFKNSNTKIDLGGIAKGYAIDCAVKKLKEEAIKDCLINAGGDIYCLGTKFGSFWKVAIKDPRKNGIIDYIELKDKAIATSGDYEQYFIKDKKRYSHIFNPKTGYPTDSAIISVTVIAPDCLTADALATASFVLGKDKTEALIKKIKGVEIRIIEEKDVQNN